RIMFRHILPNAMGSLVVATTLSIGTLILLESTLSFLGLGTQPPAASWGNMLTNAQDLLQEAPVLALWPGLLIFLTVIAFNFLGDGLLDALDLTLELSLVTMVVGLIIGLAGAAARVYGRPWLKGVVAVYVEAIRNTPLIVQLFLIFFGLPSAGLKFDANTAAMVALSIN